MDVRDRVANPELALDDVAHAPQCPEVGREAVHACAEAQQGAQFHPVRGGHAARAARVGDGVESPSLRSFNIFVPRVPEPGAQFRSRATSRNGSPRRWRATPSRRRYSSSAFVPVGRISRGNDAKNAESIPFDLFLGWMVSMRLATRYPTRSPPDFPDTLNFTLSERDTDVRRATPSIPSTLSTLGAFLTGAGTLPDEVPATPPHPSPLAPASPSAGLLQCPEESAATAGR